MAEPRSADVRVVETHSAVVLLTADRAYKWKKPVDLGFLDFRDPQDRLVACTRELELNRRLAPDVYLGVSTITDADGTPVEHVVVMRRLPDARRLSTLVEEGADVGSCLRAVARAVTGLHARGAVPAAVDAASAESVRGNWDDNLEVLRTRGRAYLDFEEVEEVGRLARHYLAGREPLLATRAGLACDGHGDLLADDIFCLDDGPRIIDCLDFDERFRLGDPLLDVAFLAMDLQRLGRADLAERFVDWYREFSGQAFPASLVHHYVAYRAHVRAKVAVLRADQGDAQAADGARRLHALAHGRLVAGQVPLVCVGGLPGAGKSTVARAIADAFGWALLSTDAVRKRHLGIDPGGRAPDEAYTPEARTAVYGELLREARLLLERGEPVVLDGSWLDPAWRDAAAAVARRAFSPLVALDCHVPAAIARARVGRRAAAGGDPSDATPAVHDRLGRHAVAWPVAHPLDTAGEAGQVAGTAVDILRRVLARGP